MSSLANALRAFLIPFIEALGAVLLLLLLVLVVQRSIREAVWRLQLRRRQYCEPLVNGWLAAPTDTEALERLIQGCRGARRRAATHLLLAPLSSITGDLVEPSREALKRFGMRDQWLRRLRDRRWWVQCEAARALGLIVEPQAVAPLVMLLDDEHEEVRAAAVEALGRVGDASVLPTLAARLLDPRHQRARLVEALRRFGSAGAEAIVKQTYRQAPERRIVAEVLGQLGSAAGLELLAEWSGDPDPALRAICYRAIGDIGLDERAYYFALRALEDPEPAVRAMAARALGLSGRFDASRYLAAHLKDEWTVAAHSAAALKQLGDPGLRYLVESAKAGGDGADLARQMLWELQS